MRYLLEYTIEIVCKGNRSECARRMGLEYPELRKFRKRMSEGGGSARITEALLEMYWRENLSVDKALAAYTNSRAGQDIEDLENECNELVLAVRTAISENQRIALGETQLLRAAYNFLEELERSFCNSTCLKTKYQETPCPVNRFIEYLKWAKDELPEWGGKDEQNENTYNG